MRRFIIGSIIIATAILLSSCSIGGVNSDMFNKPSDRELADARFEMILDAIENNNRDALKEMFYEKALDEVEDIDEEMEQLFALFPNGIDSWESMGAPQTSESINHGNKKKSITGQFYVNVGDKQYRFLFIDRTINTESPDEVGLYGIDIVDEENREFRAVKAGIYIAIGDRIVPQPPEKEDPYANEEVFEMYDLTFTVPAGLERQVFVGAEKTVSVYLESDDDDSPASCIGVSPTRSSWDGSNGDVALETDSDGAPILTPQSVISQYIVEPEVTAVFDTGTLTIGGKPAAYIEVELITGTDPAFVLKARLASVIYDGVVYDFLYSASPERYNEYLEAAQGIIDTAQFKAEK